MKNYIKSIFLILLAMSLFACQLENKNSNGDTNKKETETAIEVQDETVNNQEEQVTEADPFREPSDDEIREYGIIKEIEDGVYPIFNITVEFPKREMEHTFILNHGALTGFDGDLFTLKGKYISFYYLEDWENDLMDIFENGKTLLGEYTPDLDPEWKSITGILSGAENETQSDLPSIISVTDIDGNKLDFKFYIDETMVKANGKEVQAYFSFKGVSTITHINPTEE